MPEAQAPVGNAARLEDLGLGPPEATPGLLLSGRVDASVLQPAGPITGVPLGDWASVWPTIDELIAASPSLSAALDEALAAGWEIREGEPGEGTYALRAERRIVVDPLDRGAAPALAGTLAHELGHATSPVRPSPSVDSPDRFDYVQRGTAARLRGEADATVLELRARDEIVGAWPDADPGISGATAEAKQALWEEHAAGGLSHEELIDEIALQFALFESPSTDPTVTYDDYYARGYEEAWDARHGR